MHVYIYTYDMYIEGSHESSVSKYSAAKFSFIYCLYMYLDIGVD